MSDWYYRDHPETGEETGSEFMSSLRIHRCVECGDYIPSGQTFDRFQGWNPEEREWEIWDTCQTCMNIWDDICGGSRTLGRLDEVLWESCGMDLAGNIDDDDDYWEEMWNDLIEASKKEKGIHV